MRITRNRIETIRLERNSKKLSKKNLYRKKLNLDSENLIFEYTKLRLEELRNKIGGLNSSIKKISSLPEEKRTKKQNELLIIKSAQLSRLIAVYNTTLDIVYKDKSDSLPKYKIENNQAVLVFPK